MKEKTKIIIAILTTVIILTGCYFEWQYELDKNQAYYNAGYASGLFYTSQTGNIVLNENGNITETTIGEVCNVLIQQQLNSKGGQ